MRDRRTGELLPIVTISIAGMSVQVHANSIPPETLCILMDMAHQKLERLKRQAAEMELTLKEVSQTLDKATR